MQPMGVVPRLAGEAGAEVDLAVAGDVQVRGGVDHGLGALGRFADLVHDGSPVLLGEVPKA